MKRTVDEAAICHRCCYNDSHIMIECGYNDKKYAFCDKFDNVVATKSECKFFKLSDNWEENYFDEEADAEHCDNEDFDEERFDALVEEFANRLEAEKRNGR